MEDIKRCTTCKAIPSHVTSFFGHHYECLRGLIIPAFGAETAEEAKEEWNKEMAINESNDKGK